MCNVVRSLAARVPVEPAASRGPFGRELRDFARIPTSPFRNDPQASCFDHGRVETGSATESRGSR
eukprot:5390434-Pyramimonas_sp.AAC.1